MLPPKAFLISILYDLSLASIGTYFFKWKADRKCRPFPELGGHVNGSSILFYKLLGDKQPEAGSFGPFGAKKRLEKIFLYILVHTGTVVFHPKPDNIAVLQGCGYADPETGIANRPYRSKEDGDAVASAESFKDGPVSLLAALSTVDEKPLHSCQGGHQ